MDLLIRESSPGRWIVGRPTVRDGKIHVTGRTRWPSSPSDAVRIVADLLTAQDSPEPAETSERKRATHSSPSREPDPDRLAPQARQILHHLILRRGLTARMAAQLSPPCWRLSGRIYEIRQEFGWGAVETVYQTTDGVRYARYEWRGPDAIQIEMEGGA